MFINQRLLSGTNYARQKYEYNERNLDLILQTMLLKYASPGPERSTAKDMYQTFERKKLH